MMSAGALVLGAATVAVWRKLKHHRAKNCRSVQYVAFSQDSAIVHDCVVVDCTHPDAQTFTHHKGDNNPAVKAADCSTGIVLNALSVASPSPDLKTALEKPHVTVNHFDADALLAMWCLMHRDLAGKYSKRAPAANQKNCVYTFAHVLFLRRGG